MAVSGHREFTSLVWKIDRISRNLLDFAAMPGAQKSWASPSSQKRAVRHLDGDRRSHAEKSSWSLRAGRHMTSEACHGSHALQGYQREWNGGKVPSGIGMTRTLKFIIDEDGPRWSNSCMTSTTSSGPCWRSARN